MNAVIINGVSYTPFPRLLLFLNLVVHKIPVFSLLLLDMIWQGSNQVGC